MEKRSRFFVFVCLLVLANSAATAEDHLNEEEKIKRIDTHCHYIPGFHRQVLREKNVSSGGFPLPGWNVSSYLAFMDLLNISISVISVSTPGAVVKGLSIDQARALARELKEYGYNLTKQYPKRFKFFATFTLPDVEGSVSETVYALDTLGAAGIIALASTSGELLGNPLYEALYAELDKRHAIVFVHPGQSPSSPEAVECNYFKQHGASTIHCGFLTRHNTSSCVFGLQKRDPEVSEYQVHFGTGGFLPFATTRIIGALQLLTGWPESFILSQLQAFYVDTALSANRYTLPSTLALLNTTQLTFGSDFPYAQSKAISQNTLNLDQYIQDNLKKGALEQVRFKNAQDILSHV
ncbi:hypothetical protein R1flu_021591 [Riccia fluitans]|uniref:Amidohydrolase-related domain-containing protein n=1 Tax=Riccia fluitans TaxID=41844 RepID=A0ABD1ZQ21_9MARC